jgi:general L-amino acid transport system substrate-binding protein
MVHARGIVGAILLTGLLTLCAAATSVHAADGDTLAKVKARGALRCGVSEGIAGFSAQDGSGRWSGIDVDFCRAVAAATLGNAERVVFVPLTAAARFPVLKSGTIDLLARDTTWTLLREGALKVLFAGILFYDGQAFMVPRKGGPQRVAGLRNATVCVQKGTDSEDHLLAYSAANRLNIKPLVLNSAAEAGDAFFARRCSAYTADASELAAASLRAPAGQQAYAILPERISKEPLGPVVRSDDASWLILVRWVLFTLVSAEEIGVTRENLQARTREPAVQRALIPADDVNSTIGVDAGWTLRALQSVGNYGEIFDRNLGPKSALGFERGLNRLWTQGGLMYAPPMR